MKKKIISIISIIVLMFLFLLYFFPFAWMLGTSLKTAVETMTYPPKLLPETPMWENYVIAFEELNYVRSFINTCIVAFGTILAQFLVCTPAAYALAKKEFKCKQLIFGILILDMIIPGQIIFLPIYKLVHQLGLYDTYAALILPAAFSSFAVFFLTQSFKQVPDEIIEAARLDKTTELQLIKNIIVPSSQSVYATLGLLTFISKWNDYFWPTLLTESASVRTLPVVLNSIKGIEEGLIQWQTTMAANVLVLLPIFIIFTFANKYIKEAFAYGGVK